MQLFAPDVHNNIRLESLRDGWEEADREYALLVTLYSSLTRLNYNLGVVILDIEDSGSTHLIFNRDCLVFCANANVGVAKVQYFLKEDTFWFIDSAYAPQFFLRTIFDLQRESLFVDARSGRVEKYSNFAALSGWDNVGQGEGQFWSLQVSSVGLFESPWFLEWSSCRVPCLIASA